MTKHYLFLTFLALLYHDLETGNIKWLFSSDFKEASSGLIRKWPNLPPTWRHSVSVPQDNRQLYLHCIWKNCLMLTKATFIWFIKQSFWNVVYCFSDTGSFRNHYNMLVCCSRNISYYCYQCWRQLLIPVFQETVKHFPGFHEQEVKNSISFFFFLINDQFWSI